MKTVVLFPRCQREKGGGLCANFDWWFENRWCWQGCAWCSTTGFEELGFPPLCLSRFTDAGPDHLKVYAYSQSVHVISQFTFFKLFRYLKWNTGVWVWNATARVLLAFSSWNWCTSWGFSFSCNCAILPCLWMHTITSRNIYRICRTKCRRGLLEALCAPLQYWGSTYWAEARAGCPP